MRKHKTKWTLRYARRAWHQRKKDFQGCRRCAFGGMLRLYGGRAGWRLAELCDRRHNPDNWNWR